MYYHQLDYLTTYPKVGYLLLPITHHHSTRSICLLLSFDSNTLHENRMNILNENGLGGLYGAIIETSQEELFASLKAIVEYRENAQQFIQGETKMQKKYGVVIHCIRGKNRTGIISMLRQSMLGGISDEIIVSDNHLSESLLTNHNEGSAYSIIFCHGNK